MADHAPPPVTEKRTRFFDGQYLHDEDFIDEQRYHIDRARRHQRLLHVSGICEGLTVTSATPRTVTVAPGTALDVDGRTLALSTEFVYQLASERFDGTDGAVVYLAYHEEESDKAPAGQGTTDFRRWHERPEVIVQWPREPFKGAPPLALATITVNDRGEVRVDPGVRRHAGVRLPGPAADPAALRALPNGALTLGGAEGPARLTVSTAGRVGIATDPVAEPVQTLSVNGGLHVQNGVIQNGAQPVTTTTDLGLYSQNPHAWMRLVATQAPIRFFTDGGAGSQHRLTVEPDGRVGVGVEPQASLDVMAGAPIGTPSLSLRAGNDTNDSGAVQLAFGHNGRYRHAVRSRHTNGRGPGNALDFALWDPDAGDGTATKPMLTLNSGHVGVGTTTPRNDENLDRVVDVLGPASAALTVRGSNVVGQVVAQDSGKPFGADPGMVVGTRSGHPLTLATAGRAWMTVKENGHIGIGTTAPSNPNGLDRVVDVLGPASAALTVRGSSVVGRVVAHDQALLGARPGMTVGTVGSHPLTFATAGKARMTVDENGRVGVGAFLELRQDDTDQRQVPEVAPAIHFTHGSRSSKLVEADTQGFHLRDRDGRGYCDLIVRNVYANGNLIAKKQSGWKFIAGEDVSVRWSTSDAPSDARLKTAIRPITGALRSVLALTGMRYRWAETGLDHLTRDVAESVSAGPGATEEEHQQVRDAELTRARGALDGDDIGLLAQDVERVVPEVVHDGEDGYKYLRYGQLTALLVEALKEQQQTIERLTGRIDVLAATGGGH